jgi:hypothetical protein
MGYVHFWNVSRSIPTLAFPCLPEPHTPSSYRSRSTLLAHALFRLILVIPLSSDFAGARRNSIGIHVLLSMLMQLSSMPLSLSYYAPLGMHSMPFPFLCCPCDFLLHVIFLSPRNLSLFFIWTKSFPLRNFPCLIVVLINSGPPCN